MKGLDEQLRALGCAEVEQRRLAEIRAEVLARIAARRPWRLWAAAATVLCAGLVGWFVRPAEMERIAFEWSPPGAPEVYKTRWPSPPPVRRTAPRPVGAAEIEVAAWSEEPDDASVLVALPSSDDRVQIYFLIDSQGD